MTAETWVVDCSFAAALALPDESSAKVHTFFVEHGGDTLRVPALWWYELAKVLVVAERRGILTRADAEAAMSLYGSIPFLTDDVDDTALVRRLADISRLYGLSAYDAAYLELALRLGAPLATLDRQLSDAAKTSGVALWT